MMKIINTYNISIPSEEQHKKGCSEVLTAVLTQDQQGLFAVYIGIGSDDFILKHGLKQSYKEALNYFPMLNEKEYRR